MNVFISIPTCAAMCNMHVRDFSFLSCIPKFNSLNAKYVVYADVVCNVPGNVFSFIIVALPERVRVVTISFYVHIKLVFFCLPSGTFSRPVLSNTFST